ncbi:hypothetical protein BDV23DRAFT_179861 [Aspergillus alliaceus]|uniref:Uncharacterized protein n=1 Tax=Petromyces alliaceus TaxID=209559 RepID=A0A5N7CKH9_PETAA|nr:hypothetical protein BDV23DRAFT_179861 [Aspergillus alliaceus]
MFGLGAGLGMQMAFLAVQTVLQPLGTSLFILAPTFGGAISLATGQVFFQSKLLEELKVKALEVSAEAVVAHGAVRMKDVVMEECGSETTRMVLEAYNTGLCECFLVRIILCCLTIVDAFGTEWKSVNFNK